MMVRLRNDIAHRGRIICRGAVLSLEPFEALNLIRNNQSGTGLSAGGNRYPGYGGETRCRYHHHRLTCR